MTHELENLLRNEAEKRRTENPYAGFYHGGYWGYSPAPPLEISNAFYLECLKTAQTPDERRKQLYVIKGGKRG